MQNSSKRDGFGSKFGAIVALAGSAVGLGNIWKFPYEAGTNGGGAFLFVYLAFIFLIGLPVMLGEFYIGRRSGLNPIGAFKKLAPGTGWKYYGVLAVATATIILAFYGTVAGWTLEYIVQAVSNSYEGMSTQELNDNFNNFTRSSYKPIFYQIIFMVMTGFIIIAGVQKGIEKYTKFMMPMLFFLIIAMCIRSVTLEGASKGLSFLFTPDFSKLTTKTILSALGQAFFSLSLGMGVLMIYASYIDKKENLINISLQVIIADTLIAILAGVAIFPAVFAFNIDPASGPGLVFLTLPNVFQHMPGGYFWGILFFILLTVAALTSSISLLEVIVAFLVEQKEMTRKKATFITSVCVTILGILCTLSFGVLKDYTIFGKTIFDLFEYSSSKIMLPLGGIMVSIYAGWVAKRADIYEEISNKGTIKIAMFKALIFILRYIAPVAIMAVFISELLK